MSSVIAAANAARAVASPSHTGVIPAMRAAIRLPPTATAKVTTVAAAATMTDARALASRTRPRCGTRVKVASPVRCVHSAVTDRAAMIGRMTVIGIPIASTNWL